MLKPVLAIAFGFAVLTFVVEGLASFCSEREGQAATPGPQPEASGSAPIFLGAPFSVPSVAEPAFDRSVPIVDPTGTASRPERAKSVDPRGELLDELATLENFQHAADCWIRHALSETVDDALALPREFWKGWPAEEDALYRYAASLDGLEDEEIWQVDAALGYPSDRLADRVAEVWELEGRREAFERIQRARYARRMASLSGEAWTSDEVIKLSTELWESSPDDELRFVRALYQRIVVERARDDSN